MSNFCLCLSFALWSSRFLFSWKPTLHARSTYYHKKPISRIKPASILQSLTLVVGRVFVRQKLLVLGCRSSAHIPATRRAVVRAITPPAARHGSRGPCCTPQGSRKFFFFSSSVCPFPLPHLTFFFPEPSSDGARVFLRQRGRTWPVGATSKVSQGSIVAA